MNRSNTKSEFIYVCIGDYITYKWELPPPRFLSSSLPQLSAQRPCWEVLPGGILAVAILQLTEPRFRMLKNVEH